MNKSRLETLLQFYHDDPSDAFNIYALAMEYLHTDIGQAKSYFEKLLHEHPEYLPTYYHAAKLFQDTESREKTIATYEKGIALAKKKNEFKALRELQSAYDEFTYE